eukprot:scaffold334667_cov41-Prasinocladus_malaysianus.AAC.1
MYERTAYELVQIRAQLASLDILSFPQTPSCIMTDRSSDQFVQPRTLLICVLTKSVACVLEQVRRILEEDVCRFVERYDGTRPPDRWKADCQDMKDAVKITIKSVTLVSTPATDGH